MKFNEGLRLHFLPLEIPALIMAVLCTYWCGVRGWVCIPVFIGSWLGWFLTFLIAFFVGAFLISLTYGTKGEAPKEDHPAARRTVVWVIGFLCRLAFLRLKVTGREKLPQGRFLLVGNHRSNYDPIVAVWALRHTQLSFITKPENLKIPLAGPFIYRSNFLPIDRENPREAMKTINAAAELIENDVCSVGVYPEGTRSKTDEMLPFHNGVFKIAKKAGVPVVVAVTRGAENISKNMFRRPTKVEMDICHVFSAEEVAEKTSAAISRETEEILKAALS